MFIFEILEIFISLQKILEWNILHHKGLFNEIFLTTKDSKMEMQKFLHSSQILQRATFRWKVCTHYCGRCNNVRVAALLGFSAEQLVSGEPGPEYLTNGWLELSSIQDSQLCIKVKSIINPIFLLPPAMCVGLVTSWQNCSCARYLGESRFQTRLLHITRVEKGGKSRHMTSKFENGIVQIYAIISKYLLMAFCSL